ncbi:MAG: permease-like cell division protein FtsX, partial [Lachnospiraceae bacterium]|nr:permease-like cell division protein FtsX [Lachnospiraceae bacterium]
YAIVANFNHIVKSAEEGVAITVFFKEDTTEEDIKRIGADLEKRDEVLEVVYVSAEEAWANFQEEYFGDNKELAEGFKDDNPLAKSANYEVYMKNVEDQDELVSYCENLPEVRKVRKSDAVAKTLSSVNVLLWYGSLGIILILLGVSIFLISSTVTVGVNVRSEEIAIMKYIGAKDGFVRLPFVIEGILIGLIGAVIPLVAFYFLYNKAVAYVMTKFSLLNNLVDFLPVTQVYKLLLPVGLLLGVGIGFIGSLVPIRKHLKA